MKGRMSRRRMMILSAAATAGVVGRHRAFAATYPERAISLVVPYSPGGGTDVVARLLAPGLSEVLKKPVVVLNKPGAGALIGSEAVARAEPDGYTLLYSACDPLVMDPAIYKNLPFDPIKDFAPVSDVALLSLFLVVNANSPFTTVNDLVVYLKANPEKGFYASSSSVFWLGSELFGQQAGFKATRVFYKGSGDMVQAVLANDVTFALSTPPTVVGQAGANTIRVLATTAPNRLPNFPDVPTMSEAGVSGVEIVDWSGIWAPANTPTPIIDTLNQATRQVLKSSDLKERASRLEFALAGCSAAEVRSRMASDLEHWRAVASKANISMKL
ncbi:tripartite tricarboxylate transporter substrate binding protein [Bradyrhizobium sp. 14AA]